MFYVFISFMIILVGAFTEIYFISNLILIIGIICLTITSLVAIVKIWVVNFSPLSIIFDIIDMFKK